MTKPVLEVLGIEAVQSIQNMAHAMPLLAGRPTAIRVYVAPSELTSSVHVAGVLELIGPNGAISEVKSARSIRLNCNSHPGLASQRRDIGLAFHFPLKSDQAVHGPSRVRLKQVSPIVIGGPTISLQPNGRSIVFEEGPVLRLRVVGLRVRDPGTGRMHYPEPGHFSPPRSYLERAFPASRLEWSQIVVDAPPGFEPPFGEADAAEDIRGGRWRDLVDLACAHLMALRARDVDSGTDQRTHYYGLVHHPDEFFVGSASDVPSQARPDVVGVGPADAEPSYTAHELGHMLGGLHPGRCGETREDYDFPADFAGHLSSPALDCHGFDVGGGLDRAQVLPYDRWYDLMTYCGNLWVSAYGYRNLLDRLRAEDRLGPEAPQGSFLQVIGTYVLSRKTCNGRGRLAYVFPTASQALSGNDAKSPVKVVGLDGDGHRLFEVGAERKRAEALDLQHDSGAFQLTVPHCEALRTVQLWVEGRLVHELSHYDNGNAAPRLQSGAVRIAAPRRSAAGDDCRLIVDTPAGGDGLRHHAVQVRTAAGNWQTVACGMGAVPRGIALDRGAFGAHGEVDVRILAGSGWSEAEIFRDTLALPTG